VGPGVREPIGGLAARPVSPPERGEVVGGQPDDEAMRDDRSPAIADPVRLHRALDPSLDLDRTETRPEDPGGLALEQPLEKPLDGGKGSHVGGGV
jgi:hypothetical protein